VSPSFDDVSWPVRTERLSLRPATADDAGVTWPYRSDPATAEWVTRLPTDRAAYDEWFATEAVLGATLIVEHDGEVIGDLYLESKDAWSQLEVSDEAKGSEAEIGWMFAPEHQGHGYGTEAVEALLALCFERLGVRRVIAGCFTANEPSWRLMERVGMRRECYTVRDALHREHGWMDSFQYGLLADEWRALDPG
jgi:RimJ/RimL family protein N-acetyltransferase